ncbi:hypothetical protein SDC9_86146 [bioreactor metagenome]|uniref:Uncharacterized protein n=1 Tax=bioreactor metagenome TaxID=1076179 RepID=A0A644ZF54_9ZZZZ
MQNARKASDLLFCAGFDDCRRGMPQCRGNARRRAVEHRTACCAGNRLHGEKRRQAAERAARRAGAVRRGADGRGRKAHHLDRCAARSAAVRPADSAGAGGGVYAGAGDKSLLDALRRHFDVLEQRRDDKKRDRSGDCRTREESGGRIAPAGRPQIRRTDDCGTAKGLSVRAGNKGTSCDRRRAAETNGDDRGNADQLFRSGRNQRGRKGSVQRTERFRRANGAHRNDEAGRYDGCLEHDAGAQGGKLALS